MSVRRAIRTRLARALLNRWSVPRDVARFAFRRYRDRTFLATPTGRFTYAQMRDRVFRLVSALAAQGVRKGDPVLSLLTDDHERVEVCLAAWESGVVLTQLNVAISADQLRDVLAVVHPRVVVYTEDLAPDLLDALAEAGPATVLWTTGEVYERQLAQHEPHRSQQEVRADDPMGVGFTSGTTGKPKAMVVNQGTQLISMRLIVQHVGIGPQSPVAEATVTGIPLAGAGSGTVLPTLLAGGTLVIPERFTADAIAAAVQEHRASRIFVTPSMLIDLLDLPEHAYDLSSLRIIIYGSEQMPAAKLEEALGRFGPVLQQGYGSAEAMPPLATLLPEEHVVDGAPAARSVLSSAGLVIDAVRVRIVDESGAELPTGARGLIEVRSPTVFDGYLNRPDLNADAFRDGWFRMGDVGFVDSSGLLHVLGRASDVIRRGDTTIYPRDVEEAAHDHPAVKETAYVQVGDMAVLAVSLRRAHRDTADPTVVAKELHMLIEQNFPESVRPDRIEILDEVPRSPLAKVLRREVRAFLTERL